MDTSVIVKCLLNLLSIEKSIRDQAQATLALLQKEKLYTGALINILNSELGADIKLSASIALKEAFRKDDRLVKKGIVAAIVSNHKTPAIWYPAINLGKLWKKYCSRWLVQITLMDGCL